MTMDCLRQCYSSVQLVPFTDGSVRPVEGAWFFTPEGAGALPVPHVFGSRLWDSDRDAAPPAVGETKPRGAWSDGAGNPRWRGQHYCGSPEVWLGGVPSADALTSLDADGIPLCCSDAAPPPAGGASCDGAADFRVSVAGEAGLALDGTALPRPVIGEAALALDGTGAGALVVGEGGLRLDGTGSRVQHGAETLLRLDATGLAFASSDAGLRFDPTGVYTARTDTGLRLDPTGAAPLAGEAGLRLDGTGFRAARGEAGLRLDASARLVDVEDAGLALDCTGSVTTVANPYYTSGPTSAGVNVPTGWAQVPGAGVNVGVAGTYEFFLSLSAQMQYGQTADAAWQVRVVRSSDSSVVFGPYIVGYSQIARGYEIDELSDTFVNAALTGESFYVQTNLLGSGVGGAFVQVTLRAMWLHA